MLRLAFDFIIAWREIRARPNAYLFQSVIRSYSSSYILPYKETPKLLFEPGGFSLECEGCEKLKRGH